jgi:hypothetical protein
MADPFSIFSAIVDVLDVGARTAKGLRTLYIQLENAPDLIISLANEIEDLRAILYGFSKAQQSIARLSDQHDADVLEMLSAQLKTAYTLVIKVDILVNKMRATKSLEQRFLWLVKRNKAIELREHIKEAKQRLTEMLVAHGM